MATEYDNRMDGEEEMFTIVGVVIVLAIALVITTGILGNKVVTHDKDRTFISCVQATHVPDECKKAMP